MDKAVVVIPAFAADTLGETLRVFAPVDVHDRVRALSPAVSYGEHYRRNVVYLLEAMSSAFRHGYDDVAMRDLEACELAAGLR